MATTTSQSFGERFNESLSRRFNWQYFLQDNITGSGLLTVWVIVLAIATLIVTVRSLNAYPAATTIILIAWFIGIIMVALEGLHIRYSRVGRWLKS